MSTRLQYAKPHQPHITPSCLTHSPLCPTRTRWLKPIQHPRQSCADTVSAPHPSVLVQRPTTPFVIIIIIIVMSIPHAMLIVHYAVMRQTQQTTKPTIPPCRPCTLPTASNPSTISVVPLSKYPPRWPSRPRQCEHANVTPAYAAGCLSRCA